MITTIDKQAGTVTFSKIDFSQGVEVISKKTGKVNVIIAQLGTMFGLAKQDGYKIGFTLMPDNGTSETTRGKIVKL